MLVHAKPQGIGLVMSRVAESKQPWADAHDFEAEDQADQHRPVVHLDEASAAFQAQPSYASAALAWADMDDYFAEAFEMHSLSGSEGRKGNSDSDGSDRAEAKRPRRHGEVRIAECLKQMDQIQDVRRILRVSKVQRLRVQNAKQVLAEHFETHYGPIQSILQASDEKPGRASSLYFVILENGEDGAKAMAGVTSRTIQVCKQDLLLRSFERSPGRS